MKKAAVHIISFLLIVLWVYAAVSKLADLQLFASQLRLQPLPEWSIPLLLWLLPYAEILVAILLCFQMSRSWGLFVSWMLLTVFAVYTALALSGTYGRIPCSCGGIFSFLQWKGHLVFNSVAALLAFLSWRYQTRYLETTTSDKQKYYAHIGKEAENPATE